MRDPNHNSVVVIWWMEDGVLMTYVVDSITLSPDHPVVRLTKIPGGRSEPGETPWQTALREVREEVGLELEPTLRPYEIHRETSRNGRHQKFGYLIPRSECRGDIRTLPLIEENSVVSPPRAIPLEEALRVIHHTPKNRYHLNTLIAAWEMVSEERGANHAP
jgi:8-oxo-dGTP pyrophosphatase MutT (NUDIX family)